MKKIISLILLLSLAFTPLRSQSVEYFKDLKDINGISSIFMSKDVLDKVPELNYFGKINFQSIMDKVTSLSVYSGRDRLSKMRMRKQIDEIVSNQKFSPLLATQNYYGDRIRVYVEEFEEESVFIIYTYSQADTSLVCITGHFTKEDIKSLLK